MTASDRTLVVGLGNPDRGDDGVGALVVERLRSLDLGDVDLVERADPIHLLDVWSDYQRVIVVDAVLGCGPPGTVLVRDPAASPLPASAGTSSHLLDLAEIVELARSLDQLPPHLVLVGVEAAGVGIGEPLSPAVQAAVGDAIDAVLARINESVIADV